MMQYLRQSRYDVLTLKANDRKCYAGIWMQSLLVIQTSRVTLATSWPWSHGAIVSYSRKQKLNTRSSTEAELVAADDIAGPMLWTANFLNAQGFDFNSTLLQDNQSAIKLETNGR